MDALAEYESGLNRHLKFLSGRLVAHASRREQLVGLLVGTVSVVCGITDMISEIFSPIS